MKLFFSMVILAGLVICLTAQNIIFAEMTPAATGLNGLTLLCESASDNIGNPVTTASGTTTNFLSPFSLAKTNVYGCHTSQWISFVKLAAGTAYLHADGYRQTDYYINGGVNFGNMVFGYTRHFVFDKVNDDSDYESGNDFGVRYDYMTGIAEATYRQYGDRDEWLMNALWRVTSEFQCAAGVLLDSDREYSYRIGSKVMIGDVMSFFASWQSDPSRLGFGVKLSWDASDLTYAVRNHNELDMTHAVEFGYRW